MLYLCLLLNVLLRKVIKADNFIKDLMIVLITFILGGIAVEYARKLGGMYGGKMTSAEMTMIKVAFVMPFFEMGHLFRKYLITKFKRINRIIFFTGCILVQAVILLICGGGTGTGLSTVHLWFGHNAIITYLGAINGIVFWLRICCDLETTLSKSRVINYISNNTWSILIHHQLWIWIAQIAMYLLNKILPIFIDIDTDALFGKYWYMYSYHGDTRFNIIYVAIGIGVPILLKWVYDRVRKRIRDLFIERKSGFEKI